MKRGIRVTMAGRNMEPTQRVKRNFFPGNLSLAKA
jgi:hypothetical protein